jgi:transposase
MRFVPVRTLEQNRLCQWQNRRERWIGNRTELINQLRGELTEMGIVLAQGPGNFRKGLRELLGGTDPRVASSRAFLQIGLDELIQLEERIKVTDAEIQIFTRQDESCRRLMTIPGVGAITALAIRATVSSPRYFKNGRHFSAWLGLVPRQFSSGEKTRLGAISKRGDGRIRRLLIHGARAALRVANRHPEDRRLQWAEKLRQKKGWNKASVALANRNARTIFVLLKTEGIYEPSK